MCSTEINCWVRMSISSSSRAFPGMISVSSFPSKFRSKGMQGIFLEKSSSSRSSHQNGDQTETRQDECGWICISRNVKLISGNHSVVTAWPQVVKGSDFGPISRRFGFDSKGRNCSTFGRSAALSAAKTSRSPVQCR